MTRLISLGLMGLFLILGCSPSGGQGANGKKSPDFQASVLHPLGQASFHLASAYQSKPVLLVFWATWCESCKEEIPKLNQLVSTYQGRIEFASINVQDEATAVQKFLIENRVDFPVLADPDEKISNLFEVTALPSVLLLAKGGEILYYGFRLPSQEKLEAVLNV